MALGNNGKAKEYLQEGLTFALETMINLVYDALIGWADLLSRQEQPEKAVTILSFARDRINESLAKSLSPAASYADNVFQLPLSRYLAEQQLAALKTALSSEIFATAEKQSETLTLETVTQEVLAIK